MPTEIATRPIPTEGPTGDRPRVGSPPPADDAPARILGLACRNCGRPEELGRSYVCSACFGPLEVAYDIDVARQSLTREAVASRSPGIWRYLELLPVDAPPERGLAVGSTPLVDASRLGAALGIDRLWVKDDTRNPSLSFKDRAVAIAAATAVRFGIDTLACASTGNLAGATAAAAAAAGLPAYVFIPADLEPAKIDHALAYGATVVPIDGTYDDVNRLCLELADETGWGFVNVNLRPFYAEGSKTLAFEIAEGLGWRSPDVIVAPIASGAMYAKLAKGFAQLADAGLIERRPIRFVGGQAAGCAPVATAWSEGTTEVRPVRNPDTFVRSLAIGNPADGRYAVELANGSGGSIEAVPDLATAAAIRQLAALEGVFAETAGGVTVAAAEQARRGGVIGPDDEVVVLVTGNGLKTPEARLLGIGEDQGPREGRATPATPATPGTPGLAPVLAPSLTAFETWLEGRS
jgi:threonine synthase